MTKGNKTSAARETVYDRCAYVGCYNGKFINGRRLFHFPSETDRRLEMWIERSGNFRLRTWAATSLRKAGLCGDHFDDKCFTNATRKALRRNVVPRHYTEDMKFRKANGESATENNENNENNKKRTATEEDEDDPLNCERLLLTPTESTEAIEMHTDRASDETPLETSESVGCEANAKVEGGRSPSPVVEFIVEELDESLIDDESCKSEQHHFSPAREPSDGDAIFEYEEKAQVEDEESGKQSTSPMRLEETRESTGPGESGLRVNRSDSKVRTYYRSTNHRQMKLESASGESEPFTDDEISATPQTNPTSRPNSAACANTRHETMLLSLRDENKHLRKTMRVLKQKLCRAKARESNFKKIREMLRNVDEFLNIQECSNPVARAMVKLALHKHNSPYTREEKDFATQLYRHSSTAFARLRSAGCNFPGKSTIRRWMTEDDGQPSTCDFMTAAEADEEEMVEDIQEIDEVEMVEEAEELAEEMEEAVEDAEDAIDELVEHLEEQIVDAEGHEEYVEELPPDEDDEEDLK